MLKLTLFLHPLALALPHFLAEDFVAPSPLTCWSTTDILVRRLGHGENTEQNSPEAADEFFMPLHVFARGLITEMISRDTLNSLRHINKPSVMYYNMEASLNRHRIELH